jgi:hypothetical protein
MSSVEIKLDLPDNLAREAETNGLLNLKRLSLCFAKRSVVAESTTYLMRLIVWRL